ncbi:MAG: non-lysosomal glucosylceramidase, partial [Anaerolineaceae bacterium]|nr:non-lysosomal glucosylceramidase [Anaerolineaceae bacterium]
MNKAVPYSKEELYRAGPQKTYRGGERLQIAMPLGGIGAGSINLNGEGGLQDFSIRNRPYFSAMPDEHGGYVNTDAAFALLHIKGKSITRLVEGPMPVEKIYNQGLKAQGYRAGGHEGLPRFRECSFKGEYPFGFVSLSDPDVPLTVNITGWNPFIPLDDINSSIPCTILEYTLENSTDEAVSFEFSYHLSHLAPGEDPNSARSSRNRTIPGSGVFFYNTEKSGSTAFGSSAVGVIGQKPLVKAMWFRGGWFDSISALWREVSRGAFQPNDGLVDYDRLYAEGHYRDDRKRRNGGSILLKNRLEPGESVTYPILITWHFPNVDYAFGGAQRCSTINAKGDLQPCWRPFYTSQWKDAGEVFAYVYASYPFLRKRTQAFHDALFGSTLPPYVLDAVSANLAIIKSPTVLRQENGNLWAWEGCYCLQGCCHGSCTHVWNYAQSIPHLFPQLERSMRELELERSMDLDGHINFRSALPDGPTTHDYHAASDGQLGGFMKVYREWQISADETWLKKIYPLAKRSLDYCIAAWDPRRVGVLEEPHHNTYDIEFWGPDGMCTSFYLGALSAMAELACAAGHPQDAPVYKELAQKGAEYIDQNLFNGEYYEQEVTIEGLRDLSFVEMLAQLPEDCTQEEQLLKEEGPKYQYGSGCISDGVLGVWLANFCGLDSPQNREHVYSNLQSIFGYNFKESLWNHPNPQRPGYALGDEPGLLLCTWPWGGKPTLP